MPRILVVDDDAEHRALLRGFLEKEDFTVSTAARAAEAAATALRTSPDLIVSDFVMPEGNGLALCRRLKDDRRTARTPVLLMSGARLSQTEQAEGIEQGAEDYLLKPFTSRLLVAKIRSVLQRRPRIESAVVLRAEGVVLDIQARTAEVSKRRVHLTRKEFDLLAAFLRKRGRLLSVAYLLETVWGYDPAVYDDSHTIEVHISSVRRKLGPRLARKIVTVSGVGYRFDR